MQIILNGLAALQEGQERLTAGQERLTAGQERLTAGQARLEERVTDLRDSIEARIVALADGQAAIRSEFLSELGRTRAELMDRMQNVRDDVTVNLAAAHLAEQSARSAIDQGRSLTDLLTALTRQVRQLQDAVDMPRRGGTPQI
jgi:hypothetical protein